MATLILTSDHANFVLSDSGFQLREDVICWSEWYRDHLKIEVVNSENLVVAMDALFSSFREFRSLLDFRLLSKPKLRGHAVQSHPRVNEFHINCASVGPRFRIQHGFSTIIFAREIGSDFLVNQNVTIGAHRGIPRIGDRVMVRTGAVVVGPIEIGSDVIITANAVVSSSMPDRHIAHAPRTIIEPRKSRN